MLKGKTVKNIQSMCKPYVDDVKSGKIIQLYVDGGDVNYDSFSGSVQLDKYGYKVMLSNYVDAGFIQTIPASVIPDEYDNPYMVFPIGDYKTYINENINDLRNTIYLEPITTVLPQPVIMNKKYSLYTNLANMLWACGERFKFSQDDKDIGDVRRLDKSKDIAKRIRLLKGKISIANKNIANPEAKAARIDALKAEISDLRTSRHEEQVTEAPEKLISKVSYELIRGAGYKAMHNFIISSNIKAYLNKSLKDEFLKTSVHAQLGNFSKLNNSIREDVLAYFDKLSADYQIDSEITEVDDCEIFIHCKQYLMVKAEFSGKVNQAVYGG